MGLISSVYLDLTSIKLDNAASIPINLMHRSGPEQRPGAFNGWHVRVSGFRSRRTTLDLGLRNCDQLAAHAGSSNLGRAGQKRRGWVDVIADCKHIKHRSWRVFACAAIMANALPIQLSTQEFRRFRIEDTHFSMNGRIASQNRNLAPIVVLSC